MLAFLFLRYLSDNYEEAARKELGDEWPETGVDVIAFPASHDDVPLPKVAEEGESYAMNRMRRSPL